jgi:signal transduction histidine kinase/ligand-binding sensor domain-containing protein/DNA-binding response OmpR family regulator
VYILHLINIFDIGKTKTPSVAEAGKIAEGMRIRILRLLSIWLLLLLPAALPGQSPYKVYYYTTEDGLPQNTVSCVIKDSRGFLWFGTPNGLCRFDGYQVKVYKSVAKGLGVNLNAINSLCEDEEGNLWIGSDKGLLFFDFQREKLSNVNFPQHEMAAKKINAVLAQGGALWLATESGLFQYLYTYGLEQPGIQAESFRTFQPNERFNTLTNTRDYGLFTGSNRGLYRYDTVSREIIPARFMEGLHSDLSNDIRSVYEARDKSIWIGTFFGLVQYIPSLQESFVFFHNPDNSTTINHSTIRAFAEDSKGNLLVGALGGLDIYNPDSRSFRRFSPMEQDGYGLSNIFVSSLCTDSYGNVWIGTDKGGLNYYNVYQKPFGCLVHNPKDGKSLSNNTINSIIEKDGLLWIGTAGGGLNRMEPGSGKFRHFQYDPHDDRSLSSNFISALFFDREKNLWIGTWGGGLDILDAGNQGRFQHHTSSGEPYSLSNNFISSIIEYNKDYLIIGTEGELNFFNKRSGHYFHLDEKALSGIRISEVGCMLLDKKNNLWIGTRRGLFRLSNLSFSGDALLVKPGDIRIFKETVNTPGLKGNYITALIEARDDVIWIGTYGNGINKCYPLPYGEYGFQNYSEINGLCNNVIYRIEEDNAGKLWISTDNGLARFDPDIDEFKNLYQKDGLLSSQFYWSASYKNNEGLMYFGTVSGLNFFDPAKMIDYPFIPEVTFTDFKIFNESLAIGQKRYHRVPLKKSISSSEGVEISYRDNVFSIEFAALGHFLSEKTTYAYKMNGVDKDWVYVPASRRFATYTNLKGGSYLFQVKAINSDGISSNLPRTLIVNIIPPFWETWWFRIFMAIILTIVVIGYVKFRTRYLNEQKVKLEHLVNDRTAKIAEQKGKLELQAANLLNINKELEIHQHQIEGQKQELEVKNLEILKQRDELIRLNRRVRQVNQFRLRFFTNISHEFRTPLTLILGPVESLSRLLKSESDGGRLVQTIQRNAQRLLHLINQLMLFRRLEEGKMKLQVSRNDLIEFTKSLAHSFDGLAFSKNIDFVFQAADSPSETWFDEEKLEIILFNLLSNAFKYTPEKGRIVVSLSFLTPENAGRIADNHPYCSISLKDSGIGIPTENIDKIFGRFYRSDSPENQKINGTGLGLAFTRELVEAMHGHIFVNSEPGQGTTFTVRIPFTKNSFSEMERSVITPEKQFDRDNQLELLEQEMIHPEVDSSEIEQVMTKPCPTILVVEDSFDLRSFIVNSFRNDYRMLEAANGMEACELVKKYAPDLIISDVMMPFMDGLELCSRVKKNLATSHIPVILLTAKTLLENWIEGLETGADDYIPKPFNIRILEAKCKSLIENRKRLKKVFEQTLAPVSEEITTTPVDEEFMQKTIKVVEENINNPEFGVQKLATELCVSRSLLHKKLTAIVDLSANDFITSMRLKKSAVLLQKGNLNISEIAFEVGFNDPKYFSRCFRKHFGQSPTEYMNGKVQAQ